MATQSNNAANRKTQAKRATTEAKKSAAPAPSATQTSRDQDRVAEKNQAQVVAETAVDLPVGVVLTVSDRISDLVEPWTGRSSAEKQIKAYRTPAARNR